MTAKERITNEFISRFYTWLDDYKNMEEREYAHKYGWYKKPKQYTDNLIAVAYFQKHIFSAYKSFDRWNRAGYDLNELRELNKIGFLSYAQKKWEGFYFISQNIAKQMLKEHKQQGL